MFVLICRMQSSIVKELFGLDVKDKSDHPCNLNNKQGGEFGGDGVA